MKNAPNTIRKQTLLFNYNGKADGFALQKEVSDWCNFTLIPEIELQLELFDLGENYMSIDTLEIEATVNTNDWKQKINDELIFSLNQKLSDYKPTLSEIKEEIVSKKTKLDELILFYFENGYLPWWGKALINEDFKTVYQSWISEEMSSIRAEFISERLEQIVSKNLVKRIINQVPQKLYFQLLKNIYRQSSEIISQLESFFEEEIANNISPEKEKLITKTLYSHLLKVVIKNKGKIDSDSILTFLYKELKSINVSEKRIKPQPIETERPSNPLKRAWQELLISESKKLTIETEAEMPSTGKNIQEEMMRENKFQYNKLIDKLTNPASIETRKNDLETELQEGIFIDNAGLVIFAAFIPALFKKLAIEKDGEISDPNLAALIIQYCVTGNKDIAEYELVLPKILCGLDIEFPINTNTRISDEQMRDAEEMLQSVIEYWSVLQNTSIEGLRESFLQRAGKLSLVNKNWVLQVEQHSIDILLNSLPWGISMMKLPWMKYLLNTEWI
ncbi:MAG TPA: contractile injection system tape measure protein [Prolixibacteraceae bacterium]|nr:contractile injection system tape measure protein [Prolixibacteraceae bacterium]